MSLHRIVVISITYITESGQVSVCPAGLIHLSFKFECNYVNLGLIRIYIDER